MNAHDVKMFQRVLVPLDGSKLAEHALPHVRNLSQGGFIGEIILLNVVEIPVAWLEGLNYVSILNAHLKQSTEYLRILQEQLTAEGLSVKAEILKGTTAQAIIDYAVKNGVDLIVIGTHGYTGMKKLAFGSIALQVLHEAHCPVLMIRPKLQTVMNALVGK
ncbi:MAG: universal stress protein [Syntrophaceae bacterium]|nr:universal stress protein [Syntrophaceae bacterium]